jgi:hypothetical protein
MRAIRHGHLKRPFATSAHLVLGEFAGNAAQMYDRQQVSPTRYRKVMDLKNIRAFVCPFKQL